METKKQLLAVIMMFKRVRLQPERMQLHPGEYFLLRSLADAAQRKEPMHVLGKRLGLSPAAMSGKLAHLEAQGFLSRSEDAGDRRRIGVTLTDSGWKTLSESERVCMEIGGRLVEMLGDKDAEAFVRLSQKVLTSIETVRQSEDFMQGKEELSQ